MATQASTQEINQQQGGGIAHDAGERLAEHAQRGQQHQPLVESAAAPEDESGADEDREDQLDRPD